MAETTQIKNELYKLQLKVNAERLHALFSEDILGFMYNEDDGEGGKRDTFEKIVAFSGKLTLKGYPFSLRGLEYLVNLTELNVRDNNNLTDIPGLVNLTKLTKLYIYQNSIKSLNFYHLNSVSTVLAYDNSLETVYGIAGKSTFVGLKLQANNLATSEVDKILSDCRNAYDAGSSFTDVIDLTNNSVPTNGSSNSDYVYLTDNGVNVSIDT